MSFTVRYRESCEGKLSKSSRNKIELYTLDEIVQTMQIVVHTTIHTAAQWVLNDVRGEFFYPDPKITPTTSSLYPDFLNFDAMYKEKYINWINIQDFSVNEIFSQVRDYIHLWNLSECTKFSLATNDRANVIPNKGAKYFIDATFSKPTPACPNPLAVAKVFFTAIVPSHLPKHYPIMVTYRFEGFRTQYHVHGRHEVRSKDFQRFFIDSILQRKLVFYSRIFECRHPDIKLKRESVYEGQAESEELPKSDENGAADDENFDVENMRDKDMDFMSLIGAILKK
uniref:Uncharacterized protein n=1 Tax=Ceratitis capitata TaxID=7213 RepID=W8BPX1_CERCA